MIWHFLAFHVRSCVIFACVVMARVSPATFRNPELNQPFTVTIQSEPIDLAVFLFSKAGMGDYIA